MRAQIQTRSSTKAERQFSELLKKHHIPFKFREKIAGREVDFLIGKVVVEIGDHSQDIKKNKMLLELGYSLLFFTNKQIREDISAVEKHLTDNWIKK